MLEFAGVNLGCDAKSIVLLLILKSQVGGPTVPAQLALSFFVKSVDGVRLQAVIDELNVEIAHRDISKPVVLEVPSQVCGRLIRNGGIIQRRMNQSDFH